MGKLELQIAPAVSIDDVRVYPNDALTGATVELDLANIGEQTASGTAAIQVDSKTTNVNYSVEANSTVTVTQKITIENPRLWSEFDPYLYTLTASLENGSSETVSFGMRRFAVEDSRFTINGDYVFLRNEANCAVFPLTAYAPMDEEAWEKLFTTYQSYGLNSVRFHSWCPPEAAFAVADRLGMYLIPELSCWDPSNMFDSTMEKNYYTQEAFSILKEYANHPSFVAMTFGNELYFAGGGADYANELLADLQEEDDTRLYAGFSNGNYGNYAPLANADFFTGQTYRGTAMRGIFAGMSGFINQQRPATTANYNDAVERAKNEAGLPVFSFEVGQFQIFPDVLTEIEQYTGVLEPRNLELVRQRLEAKGIDEETVAQYINASGMLSQLGYRMEFEAALRTENFGGISFLGIQDFSGQGTALVGMMNALGDPKPYDFADPDTFRQWSSPVVPLWETEKFCYTNDEHVTGKVLLSNYSAGDLTGNLSYALKDSAGETVQQGTLSVNAAQGELATAGEVNLSLAAFTEAEQLSLELCFGDYVNTYDLWVYPEEQESDPGQVYVTGALDEMAKLVLEDGGSVFLSPSVSKSTLPQSITGTFTTAFWSSIFVSDSQPGSMGLLLDPEHPVFDGFPTDYYTNYQWWAMSKLGRPMILEGITDQAGNQIQPLIQVIDSFAQIRTMGLLFEAKVGNGKLVVSSMGLEQLEKEYPEAKALKNSILAYMNSDAFNPASELTVAQIDTLVQGSTSASKANLAEKSNGGSVTLAEGTYTCQEGYDRHPQDRALELNDGVVDTDTASRSWSDWNPKKNYPDVVMTATLSGTFLVDSVNLPSFQDSGTAPPAEILVEYWNGEAFVPVEHPSKTTGFVKGENLITFDPVETNQIRFTLKHQSGMGLAISEVMVFEREIVPTAIQVTGDTTAEVGETIQLTASFTPEDSNRTDVMWSVLGEDGKPTTLASVNGTGKVTAKAAGTVMVQARLVANPQVTGSLTVTIAEVTAAVDKSKLEAAIENAEAKDEQDYSAASWRILEQALAAAKDVFSDDAATQAQVDHAAKTLNDAVAGLKEKPTTPVKPSKPVAPNEPEKPEGYVDVSVGDWYYEAVSYVTEEGLMTGVGNGKFGPNGSVTRAMVWTVLARMAGENTDGGAAWYSNAQKWALETGVSDGTKPMGSITREQLAAMLYRYEGSPAVSGNLNAYPDAGTVSDWAVDALVWATEEGVINGMGGKLSPSTGATRAQLAAMLMRFDVQ